MTAKVVLIVGMICFNFNICMPQSTGQIRNKYVIVPDIQSQFFQHKPFEGDAMDMIKTVNALTALFASEKVIYVKAAGKTLSVSLKGFSVDTMVAGMDTNLKIVSNHVFTRFDRDAFTSADLNDLLTSSNAREIVLAGLLA